MLSFEDIIYKTILINRITDGHNNFVIFNANRSSFNPISLDLLWLKKFNLWIDLISYIVNFFHSIIKKKLIQIKNYISYTTKTSLVGTIVFIHVRKWRLYFVIYATSIFNSEKTSRDILS